MDDTDALLAEATLGQDAEAFMRSQLGRYMAGCCAQEIEIAQEELSTVSWWRHRRIKQLQNQIWRARSFTGWLRELINSGKAAQENLQQLEAED